ncbi:hypothetical protein BGY98DRAFT_307718 [Russula aff. rugulosa BPL654]|nr:hypothetical protein BGY98DRAFT_307718 [Russula aff. rugulosa BPL654]
MKMGNEVLTSLLSFLCVCSLMIYSISFRPPEIALRGYMYSIARKYGRAERPETPRGAVDSDQEACKEHLFTAKSRDYQRSQKGKERKKSVVGKPSCAFSGCD